MASSASGSPLYALPGPMSRGSSEGSSSEAVSHQLLPSRIIPKFKARRIHLAARKSAKLSSRPTEPITISSSEESEEDDVIILTPTPEREQIERQNIQFEEFTAPGNDTPLPHQTYNPDMILHAPKRDPIGYVDDQRESKAGVENENRRLELARYEGQREWELARQGIEEEAGMKIQLNLSKQRKLSTKAGELTYKLELLTPPLQPDDSFHHYRCVEMFPYAHFAGLHYMDSVFAVCGGAKIELYHVGWIESSEYAEGKEIKLTLMQEILSDHEDETYLTLAWSIDTHAFPFLPILAVSGAFKVINILNIKPPTSTTAFPTLVQNRTLIGHGRRINHLAFSLTHPHILASASDDSTIIFWNPTVPWGTDSAILATIPAGSEKKKKLNRKKEDRERPAVEGEVLGKVTANKAAVLSFSFHPLLPLIVTSGVEGTIKIFEIPPEILLDDLRLPQQKPPSRDTYIPQLTPPNSESKGLVFINTALFSSKQLHQGCWVDQVFWNGCGTEIISKGAKPHANSKFRPQKSIKIWRPKVLDLLALEMNGVEEYTDIKELWEKRKIEIKKFRKGKPIISSKTVNSDLAFDILNQIAMEDENLLGNSIAHFSSNTVGETILGIPSTLHETSIYFYTSPDQIVPSQYDFPFHSRLFPTFISDIPVGLEQRLNFRHATFEQQKGEWMIAVGDEARIGVWSRN